jgi:hypothetical protein
MPRFNLEVFELRQQGRRTLAELRRVDDPAATQRAIECLDEVHRVNGGDPQ